MIADVNDSFLVVIDMQQRLLSAMGDAQSQQLLKQTRVLLTAAKELNVPVAITEQYPQGLGNTEASLLNLVGATTAIEKTSFSAVKHDDFMNIIRRSKRRSIILMGIEAHICVLQTALELKGQGFKVFIVEDAVCSRLEKNKDNALQRLSQAGVIISNAESVLFEWLTDAKNDKFRQLSKLIQ